MDTNRKSQTETIRQSQQRRPRRAAALALGLVVGCLLASPAAAQGPVCQVPPSDMNAVVVLPRALQFISIDHNTMVEGAAKLLTYMVELWLPGQNTAAQGGGPQLQTPDLPKAIAVPASGIANCYEITMPSLNLVIPEGPTYVATILSKGPNGANEGRSAASNPFRYPMTMGPPARVTGVKAVPGGAPIPKPGPINLPVP